MSRDHHHHPSAGSGGDRRPLFVALCLIAAFLGVELVAGVLADSLALLADAGHMLSDTGALGLALFATWIAERPATAQRTYGLRRAEILAALANGTALVAISVWISVEAVQRLFEPSEPLGGWMLAVGVAGVAVNVAAALVLRRSGSGSLNVRAATRHVFADLLGSVGVIVAAVVILLTGWLYADPVASLVIALLVLGSSWTILRESIGVLLEGTPAGLDADEVGRAIGEHALVRDVHDLHVWSINSGFAALSAHVLCDPGANCHAVRRDLERMLLARFGLSHTTLQVDHVARPQRPLELRARVGSP